MSRAVVFVLAFAAAVSAVAAPKPNSIAVMDTSVQGVSEALGAQLSQTLSSYCENDLKMEVISKDDVKKLISFEQQKQLLGCESEACATAGNVGEALGVEKLMTSTIGKLGERIQLSVVVLDVVTNKRIGSATREIRDPNELAENARDLAHFALKHEERESKGYARIEVAFEGATITIDGQVFGKSPIQPVRLLQGKHAVRIEKDGYIPLESNIDVLAGKEALLEAKLLPKKDVKVAGVSFLPWAGATAGVAVVAGGLAGYFYMDAKKIYQNEYLNDPNGTGVNGPVTKSQLDAAKEKVEFRGNTLAYYSTWTAGIMGGLSVALFSAYAVAGLGAGGDAPPADPQAVHVEPTADGFALRF